MSEAATGPQRRKDRRFRPSAADRWIRCYGSVKLCEGRPQRPSSSVAREGTAAHKVAELCLRNGQNAIEYLDRSIDADDGGAPHFFEEHDIDSIQLYLDVIRGYMVDGAQAYYEVPLTLASLDATDPLLAENAGTADTVIVDKSNNRIIIFDLKFGRGVAVSADAYQLKNYALMALFAFPRSEPWETIVTIVVQPRLPFEEDRIKIVEHKSSELQDFIMTVYTAMVESQKPNAPLVPGEKQCRWCDGKPDCVAVMTQAANVARAAFDEGPSEFNASMPLPPLPSVEGINPQIVMQVSESVIAGWLDRRAVVEAFLQAVEERAVAIMEAGGQIPGYKLTRRSGNRRWLDAEAAFKTLTSMGVPATDMQTEPKMKSPAQVEKLKIGGIKDMKKAIEPLYEKPLGSVTLVRDSDSRAALPGAFTPQALPPLP